MLVKVALDKDVTRRMHEIKQRILSSKMLVAGKDFESKVKAFMTSSNFAGTEVKTSKLLNGGRKLGEDF